MAKSKMKQIEHMELIAAPERYDNRTFHAQFNPEIETGKEVLTVKDLAIGYEAGKVLCNVNMNLEKGQKIGIIGGNGLGKSTFLKTVTDRLPALGGEYHYGIRVKIGYFDQQMAQYSSEKQVIDDYWDEFPQMTQTEVRSALGAFLFSGDDVFKKVSMLSGGERVRLALCKILTTKPNLLILDEPTNHMDIIGKETLERMLKDYTGTVLFVSHDRYFIKQISDKLLSFEKDRNTEFYQFGYEEYLERKAREQENSEEEYVNTRKVPVATSVEKAPTKIVSNNGNNNPGKERAKLERKVKKAEEAVTSCEEEIEALHGELMNPDHASSYAKLEEIQAQIDEKEEMLLGLMEEWESCQHVLEAYNEENPV